MLLTSSAGMNYCLKSGRQPTNASRRYIHSDLGSQFTLGKYIGNRKSLEMVKTSS